MATTQFVIDNYRNLLNRLPAVDEIIAIRNYSEQEILRILTGSNEAETKSGAIVRLYYAYFDREPDLTGFKNWQAELISQRLTLEQIGDAFASSQEFTNTYGSLSNLDFVVRVYNNTLEREPDSGGLAAWTAAVDQGMSRGTLMANFSESIEFQQKKTNQTDVILSSLSVNGTIPTTTEITARSSTNNQNTIFQYSLNDRSLSVSASGSTLTLSNKPSSTNGISIALATDASTLKDGSTDITPTGTTVSDISIILASNLSGKLTVTSGEKSVTITGGSGDDEITGSAKDDTISTGEGADTITAGVGGDTQTGGDGNDKFILATGDSGVVSIAGTLASAQGTITYVADALDSITINGTSITYTAATDDDTTATAIVTAINDSSAVNTIVTASNSSNVVTITSDIKGLPISVNLTGGGTGHTVSNTSSTAATPRVISSIDSITDFNAGGDGTGIVDQINLGSAISSIVSGSIASPTAIGKSALADGSSQTITTAVEELFKFGGTLTSTSVSDTIAGVFSFNSKTYLIVNAAPNTATANTASPFDGAADFIIDITGATGTLDTGDFITS